MGSKLKHGGKAIVSPADLEARVRKTLTENRTQHALDLAKQLYKQEPTAARKELLGQVYLARARQLRQQGQTKDAATVLDNVDQLGINEPGFLGCLAEEWAALGYLHRAQEYVPLQGGEADQVRLLAKAVDAALAQGPSGRRLLPEALQPAFDSIVQAFAQLQAGQDDQARESLQGIGLQSPFLDWKVLLRGLLAYYQGDDARALENWQRLNPERFPHQLIAPVRARLDPAFRQAQAPQVQVRLQRQADFLQGSDQGAALRKLPALLASPDGLRPAFNLVGPILPTLQAEIPDQVGRLASCFYWAIVHRGSQEDLQRYHSLFGAPADDPSFFRVEALVHEEMNDLQGAQKFWQKFEQEVADHPQAWGPSLSHSPEGGEGSEAQAVARANHVRALVWCRMGHNARAVPDISKIPKLPDFLRNHPECPRPLKPGAEECFRRAVELAPDLMEGYRSLFQYYLNENQDDKAEEIGRRLLERFAEDVPTLEEMGHLCHQRQDYQGSLHFFQRALQANPLDAGLRGWVGTAHLYKARQHAEAGQFDAARAEYQAALALEPANRQAAVFCKWAACEFKAKNAARAEELLQEAHQGKMPPVALAFHMLIETIRLKLPSVLKKRFNQDFTTGLAEPPMPQAAVQLIEAAGAHRAAGVTYYGQKAHEKKVLAFLNRVEERTFTEEQLLSICRNLFTLGGRKWLLYYAFLGTKRFPKNPHFFVLEAESYFMQGPQRCPPWKVKPLLEKARELANALPPDKKKEALQELIQTRLQMLAGVGSGFFNLLEEIMEQGFIEEPDDWAEDDWEEDDGDEEGSFFFPPLFAPKKKKKKRRHNRR